MLDWKCDCVAIRRPFSLWSWPYMTWFDTNFTFTLYMWTRLFKIQKLQVHSTTRCELGVSKMSAHCTAYPPLLTLISSYRITGDSSLKKSANNCILSLSPAFRLIFFVLYPVSASSLLKRRIAYANLKIGGKVSTPA